MRVVQTTPCCRLLHARCKSILGSHAVPGGVHCRSRGAATAACSAGHSVHTSLCRISRSPSIHGDLNAPEDHYTAKPWCDMRRVPRATQALVFVSCHFDGRYNAPIALRCAVLHVIPTTERCQASVSTGVHRCDTRALRRESSFGGYHESLCSCSRTHVMFGKGGARSTGVFP